MADITMCSGEGCSLKNTCHRHTAVRNEFWQSVFTQVPINDDGTCDQYWGPPLTKNKN